MNNFKRKKSVNEKETGQRKRFSYDHMCLKPRDQKMQKFLPQLLFSAPGLHREKKTGDELFRWEPEQPTNENTKISTGVFFRLPKSQFKMKFFFSRGFIQIQQNFFLCGSEVNLDFLFCVWFFDDYCLWVVKALFLIFHTC